jgi:iron complex transport system ATP-binding protein
MGRTAHASALARPGVRDLAAVDAALQRLGIEALAERPVTMISGGERQLALIARALAQEAQCVVLDEPTAALDFGNQGKVLAEISRLAAAGLGVIFSTHDPNHALRCAHRALLLRDGAPLACGPVGEVLVLEQLQVLYQAQVQVLHDPAQGRRGFLPG